MKKDSVTESEDDELPPGRGAPEYDNRKRAASGGASTKKVSGGGGASSMKSCQAERCPADLSEAKTYHRRHKVCEHHAKAQVVVVAGIRQRFCQQCSRFHELAEFDETKRSCRRRLAGHNERRRKSSTDINSQAEGGSTSSSRPIKETTASSGNADHQLKEMVYLNGNYKQFHVR
ncbi:hypothetical protein DH2020_014381 [Rehmannia glutinosa]|uniref:SBP-type domain-containing protein n=1 Tax=Rehmannia glutinosa TaxID=99300 RepID=A0ABR0WWS1_REHGL|nr:SQUAMOSA promoter-binding-like protein [Rehmannia glutinosa]